MNILHISTSDIDGGAARAAYRLHRGLQSLNQNSHMLVKEKSSKDTSIIAPELSLEQGLARAKLTFDALPLKLYRRRKSLLSIHLLPDYSPSKVAKISPDIINLHWISAAFIQIETLAKYRRPLVWTLHDMWVFTGGCHYTDDCENYTKSCGSCPQLGSNKDYDLSRWVWQRKVNSWKNLDMTIIAPSSWMAERAMSSSLFQNTGHNTKIQVIPHGLNTEVFRPIRREIAREVLNLPQDKQLILFGAVQATSDKRKGFQLLQAALQKLSKSGWEDKLELLIFGTSQPEKSNNLGFKANHLGYLHDDGYLALLYSAADVMVVPSIQECFGQTGSESLACGTPVVAYDGTGLKDIVDHKQNGYLAKPYEVEDLAQGIIWTLENQDRYEHISHNARIKAKKEFSIDLQAQRYYNLYSNILAK
jgi:glycosyltransferase involved in cell wall biosynthesis